MGKSKELEKLFMENKKIGINVPDERGFRGLHYTCKTGNLEITKLLLDNNAHLDAKTKENETPFLFACQEGHFDIAELLVSKKCDTNAADTSGKTGLHYACQNGSLNIVNLLVNNKANLDVKTTSSITPLMLACSAGNLEIVKCLVTGGCDIFATCGNNEVFRGTAVTAARMEGHKEIVDYLESHTYQTLQEIRSFSNGLDNKDVIDNGIHKTILKEETANDNVTNDNGVSNLHANSKLSEVENNKNELSASDQTYQNLR